MAEHEFLSGHYYRESCIGAAIYDMLLNNDQDIEPFHKSVYTAQHDVQNARITLVMDNGEKYTITIHKEG